MELSTGQRRPRLVDPSSAVALLRRVEAPPPGSGDGCCFRRFHLRGLPKVQTGWQLACLSYSFKRLFDR